MDEALPVMTRQCFIYTLREDAHDAQVDSVFFIPL